MLADEITTDHTREQAIMMARKDHRVADVQTVYDPVNGNFNTRFATVTPLVKTIYDGSGHPALKRPKGDPFLVENIFTDFKRHDLGPNFYERNYDGTIQKLDKISPPPPPDEDSGQYLGSPGVLSAELILLPPDDTASNLDPGNRSTPGFPQFGHGSIKLTLLFDDPTDPE